MRKWIGGRKKGRWNVKRLNRYVRRNWLVRTLEWEVVGRIVQWSIVFLAVAYYGIHALMWLRR
jgi:hypothetical protein